MSASLSAHRVSAVRWLCLDHLAAGSTEPRCCDRSLDAVGEVDRQLWYRIRVAAKPDWNRDVYRYRADRDLCWSAIRRAANEAGRAWVTWEVPVQVAEIETARIERRR